jgi:hypothetical protein
MRYTVFLVVTVLEAVALTFLFLAFGFAFFLTFIVCFPCAMYFAVAFLKGLKQYDQKVTSKSRDYLRGHVY